MSIARPFVLLVDTIDLSEFEIEYYARICFIDA